ncbi:MAG: class I SAM-dependent methyltransferase [Clostridia bacterium]|nr:class I SAM-dependent methyltransferase [Clostridia bacterium]
MSDIYVSLADCYDRLTSDVPYEKWADFIEKIFKRYRLKPEIVLDLACGTGSLTKILASRGYDMIGVDMSSDMLDAAMRKCACEETVPLFLCQSMQKLDLYGTVGAVVCSLDSINYLTTEKALSDAFARVSLFLEPEGLFIFDVNTEHKLRWMDGQSFIREAEGVFCAWSAEWREKSGCSRYYIDLFLEDGDRYERVSEEHTERAWPTDTLFKTLEANGLEPLGAFGELVMRPAEESDDRIFIVARKRK